MATYDIGEVGDRAGPLANVIARARQEIPFYRDFHAGIDSVELTDLPTCSKADLTDYGPFPLSTGSPSDAFRIAATSGTTGPRLFIGYSSADWLRIGKQLAHRAQECGFGSGDLLLNTHGYGLWIGGPALDLLANTAGAGLLPAGPGSSERLLGWLATLPITAISATPSYMRYLIELAERQGIDPASWGLRVGFFGGEGASLALRRHASEALGQQFQWQELYGSTETGGPVLGFSPPQEPLCGHLLIDTEEFIVELLKPEVDEPVPPGEIGELTLTTPYREMSPLLRYRTRDLAAEVLDASPQTTKFARVTALLGRIDDALKVRGTLVYPSTIEHLVVSHCQPGAEWRIEVKRSHADMDEMIVRVEHNNPNIAKPLALRLRDAISMRPVIDVVPPGSLNRFEGKANRVIDTRPKDD